MEYPAALATCPICTFSACNFIAKLLSLMRAPVYSCENYLIASDPVCITIIIIATFFLYLFFGE
jgi:hypothetical protein